MKYYTLLSIILIFWACSVKKETAEITELSYEIKTIVIESAGGCADEAKPCAKFEVSYPVFTGPEGSRIPAVVEDRINTMLATPTSDLDAETIEAAGKAFIADFESTIRDFPETKSAWYYRADIVVENLTDKVLCISVNDEYYTGGAHGGNSTSFINFNPANGMVITLSDFLKPGYEENLRVAGEKAFRQVRGIEETAYLPERGFDFEGGQFQLNENYGFRPEGIVFFYNIYEIASYAMGPTEILIPYEEIREWLKDTEENL